VRRRRPLTAIRAYNGVVWWRAVLLFGLIAAGAGSAAAGAAATRRVAGKASTHASICSGGVRVTEEMIARLPPPQPIAGREFLVVAGDRISAARPAARFTTRPDGTFVTRLPPGTWCFFEAARRPGKDRAEPAAPATPPSADVEAGCLENEKLRCDLVLPVRSDIKTVEISFTQRCPQPWAQPCYRGPMPP
jgi:hypothetical protein